jgi:hypothetical protein
VLIDAKLSSSDSYLVIFVIDLVCDVDVVGLLASDVEEVLA